MEDTKLALYQNVMFRTINEKTGEVIERTYSNRITKTALLGIIRFIYGDFSSSNYDQASQYTPKYLALGGYVTSGQVKTPDNPSNVNATKLTNEITNTVIDNKITPRFSISSKTIINEIANDYIKLTMKIFVPNSVLVGTTINEAGIFITPVQDSCWARVSLTESPIVKDNSTTIDIVWDVTIKSIANS